MGTYLSTPATEKHHTSGRDDENNLSWGATDMQGWRASMEDAHVARRLPSNSYLFAVFDGHGGPQVSRFCALYIASVVEKERKLNSQLGSGEILVRAFHAMDRLIPERMDEVLSLKAFPPVSGEQRYVDIDPTNYVPKEYFEHKKQWEEESQKQSAALTNGGSPHLVDLDAQYDSAVKVTKKKEKTKQNGSNEGSTLIDLDDADDDSLEVLGQDETKDAWDLDEDDEEELDVEIIDSSSNGGKPGATVRAALLQKLLVQSHATPLEDRSVTEPSVIIDGKYLCNLPEYPVQAGTTAIVIWYTAQELVVANAGDSRAVLSRAGQAVPLSYDHKPQQPKEYDRILKSGGFVHSNGRVNGNLNLSRCIGDLKYKQHPDLRPEEQMITAQPDIKRVPLGVLDEFFILGCDGIWDCLTNQEAVSFVQRRIHEQRPAAIGAELVDSIIATKNPREAQGIGCDNMTILIVDLKPNMRSYYKEARPSDEIEI